MNIELAQLALLLVDYKKLYVQVKPLYDDPEYLAWISVTYNKDEWPTGGEFGKARTNPKFRAFRACYKKCRDAMTNFAWDIMPYSTRTEYQKKWIEETGGVPF